VRTLFLNPPSFDGFDGSAGSRYQARREIRSFWYPTWLAFPAGMKKWSRVLDASAHEMDVEEVIRLAGDYELVILHTSTPTVANDARIADSLKQHFPKLLVGLVGSHPTVLPKETLLGAKAVDFVAVGEFDNTVTEIAKGVPLKDVQGLAYRSNGDILRTSPRAFIENLDELPFVTEVYARDLKVEDYFIGYLRHPYVSLYAGRGCRSHCTFCLWPQTISGHVYRVRSPENLYEEMSGAKRLFPQVKEYFLDDDTFTDNPRLAENAAYLGRLGIVWSCNARVSVPKETVRLLKENGLRLLVVGFESGNQKILNNIRKGVRLDQARAFAKVTKELGILIHGTFVLGLPGESAETIEETIKFAKEIDPYSIQVSLAAPYPGTELYEQAKREGWLVKEGDRLVREGIQDAVLSYGTLSAEEVFHELDRFYRSFYLRARPILRILGDMLRDRDLFRRRILEGKEFFSFLAKRKEIDKG
jgi:hopanoid biosynthesis associated radical SAM protein HpnJ